MALDSSPEYDMSLTVTGNCASFTRSGVEANRGKRGPSHAEEGRRQLRTLDQALGNEASDDESDCAIGVNVQSSRR
jgi:hypothetical protein